MELKLQDNILFSFVVCLLIVPYGIETDIVQGHINATSSFNRTLWN